MNLAPFFLGRRVGDEGLLFNSTQLLKRPVLVLSIDAINQLPLVVTGVVGTKGENISRDYPTNVRVFTAESGLSLETVFLCFQLRSLDADRFPSKPSGQISAEKMEQVEAAVRYCLGL